MLWKHYLDESVWRHLASLEYGQWLPLHAWDGWLCYMCTTETKQWKMVSILHPKADLKWIDYALLKYLAWHALVQSFFQNISSKWPLYFLSWCRYNCLSQTWSVTSYMIHNNTERTQMKINCFRWLSLSQILALV